MASNEKQDELQMGFLTAIEQSAGVYVGGLLVTNRYGRPLEFQCTARVEPNRTQQILYGPTLVPFLLGELIGRTLLEKVEVKPHIVLTERKEFLEVRHHVQIPVAFIRGDAKTATAVESDDAESSDSIASDDSKLETVSPADEQMKNRKSGRVRIGRQTLVFHSAHQDDRLAIEQRTHLIPRDADLREPFERVREALGEAMRSSSTR